MRCGKCQKIPLKIFLDVSKIKHSENYNDLQQSAMAGCDLCRLLIQYIEDILEERTTGYGNSVRNLNAGIFIEQVIYGNVIRAVKINWGNKENVDLPELILYSPQLSKKGSNWK